MLPVLVTSAITHNALSTVLFISNHIALSTVLLIINRTLYIVSMGHAISAIIN